MPPLRLASRVDIEISKERIKSLDDQLKQAEENAKEQQEFAESVVASNDASSSTVSTDQTSEEEEPENPEEDAAQMGPPQPLAPPSSESAPALDTLLIQKRALEEELARAGKSVTKLQGEVKEGRELNKKLTDQFRVKVDLLESEHRVGCGGSG